MNYLRRLLDDVASEPAPLAEIDVDLALRTGMRIIRRRRFAWMAGAASTVVACLVASAVIFTPAAQHEPATPPELGRVFDGDKKYASFGSLPEPFTQSVVETETELGTHRQWGTNGSWQVELRMATAGHTIELTGLDRKFWVEPGQQIDQSLLEPADLPGYGEVFWNRARIGSRAFAVRWKYAPDAWIEVAVENSDRAREMLLDIVRGLRIGPEVVKMPIHLADPPGRPTRLCLEDWGNRWYAALDYEGNQSVIVESVSEAPGNWWNTEVDGKKARVENERVDVLEPSGARSVAISPDQDEVAMYRRLRIDR